MRPAYTGRWLPLGMRGSRECRKAVRGSSANSLGSSGSTRLAMSRNAGSTSSVGIGAKRGSDSRNFRKSGNDPEKPV